MIQKNPTHFDPDLDQILDRVYGPASNAGSDIDSSSVGFRESVERREQDSFELKQALAKLRETREKSQNVLRMKEEVDYLQAQIDQLRELESQIAVLRKRLSEEDPIAPGR